MYRITRVAFLLVSLVLGACSTPYQSSGITGGYSERELEPAIWRVTFGGNGYTSVESAQTYWLYRCAELALEHGFDGFEILSNIQLIQRLPQPELKIAANSSTIVPIYTGGGSLKPTIVGDIRLLHQPFTPTPPKVFEAVALKAALSGFVTGDKCNLGNVCPHAHHYLYPGDKSATGG